jgi:uncharacterized protein
MSNRPFPFRRAPGTVEVDHPHGVPHQRRKWEPTMGQAVVQFEIIGTDGARLRSYYADLFDWTIDADNALDYGMVWRDGAVNADGIGIAGGIGSTPNPDYPGHVTFYVEVPDVEVALAKAESLGGSRVFGPGNVPGTPLVLGQFTDPEGHLVGLTQAAS